MCLEHDLAFRSLAISSFARQTELMGSDAACADNFLLTECHLSLCHYISTSCAGRIQQVVSMLPRHVDYRDLAVINIQIHLKKKPHVDFKTGLSSQPRVTPQKGVGDSSDARR